MVAGIGDRPTKYQDLEMDNGSGGDFGLDLKLKKSLWRCDRNPSEGENGRLVAVGTARYITSTILCAHCTPLPTTPAIGTQVAEGLRQNLG